ncbi:response regulator transcription factor [Granulicella sp. L60]|uniref:response regulator transcription factor n=1 Tax=Granulicella sp. L60 TaxID=1641866 RepID=UPI00131B63B2|nr:response regulator [Granulicella sp. L60]
MNAKDHMVFVVDDDPRVGEALLELLSSLDFRVMVFGSATEYIEFPKPDLPTCLILDVRLPDVNGLDLQRQIADRVHPPIVFITGYGDIPSTVRAMKAGAVDFLPKPFGREQLLRAVEEALARDTRSRLDRDQVNRLKERFSHLTPRERDVLPLVVAGLLNKQAASQLGISETTLQIHRGQIMRKMAANSLAELVRMAGKLEIAIPSSESTPL